MKASLLVVLPLLGLAGTGGADPMPQLADDEDAPPARDEDAPPAPAPAPAQAPAGTAQPDHPPAPASISAAPQPAQSGAVYFDGPVYIYPAAPGVPVPQGAPAPPTLPPPVLTAPPVLLPSEFVLAPPVHRRLGLGLRFSSMWTNQHLYGVDALMIGAGAVARVRFGRAFGLEGTFDIVGLDRDGGALHRISYPVQLGLMTYLLPERSGPSGNIFTVIGGGFMPSHFHLDDRENPVRDVSATEGVLQGGVGVELHLWHVALTADARALGTWYLGRTEAVAPTASHSDNPLTMREPLLPSSNYGWSANLGGMLWF